MLPYRTRSGLARALGALALLATIPDRAQAAPPPGPAPAQAAPSAEVPDAPEGPVQDAPDPGASAPDGSAPDTQAEYEAQLAQAVEAWSAGDWPRARTLLAPLVEDLDKIEDPFERERVLRFMADATLLDATLDPQAARQSTRGYVGRLLDSDPQWSPPPGAHSDQLYEVTEELKEARRRERAAACEAELVSCSAGAENERILRERLADKHAQLQQDFDDEMVIVTDRVALNRAVALVPLGVGHFYNRNKPLGATFLSSELAFGGVGLGLMLYRIFGLNCARTKGFAPGSLVCVGKENRDKGVKVRNAEQTFGILFAGTMIIDVVLAQVLFKSTRIVGQRRVRRGDLETLGIDAGDVDAVDPDDPAAPPARAPDDPGSDSAKLEIRPASTIVRGGAGLGLRLRF